MEREFHEMGGWGGGKRFTRRMVPPPFGAAAWMNPPPGSPFPPFPPFMHMTGGAPQFGHRRRGRGRMRRGAIRAAILLVLAEQPRHGYEVMTELAERSGGMWRPSPGSVYPTLQQLEDEGLVRAEDVEDKRVFRLTDAGRAEAEKLAGKGAPWEAAEEGMSTEDRGLYGAALQLSMAASQVAQAGSPEQIASAQAVLDEARKRIYRLLAEDDPPDEPEDDDPDD